MTPAAPGVPLLVDHSREQGFRVQTQGAPPWAGFGGSLSGDQERGPLGSGE